MVIELDGGAHFSDTREPYEAARTKYLESMGLRVIRFENKELLENIDGVLETIRQNLKSER